MNAPHFRARVHAGIARAAKEARGCSRASRMPATGTLRHPEAACRVGFLGWLRRPALPALGTRLLGFEFGFFFAHTNFA